MMTAPPAFEAAIAAELGIANYVPGSLDITFVNTPGETTIRFTVTHSIDTTTLLTAFQSYLSTLVTPSSTTTDPTSSTTSTPPPTTT